jgi:hypothetical protein
MGTSVFIKHLGMIHSFVCRGDSFDALRGFLCGIEFGHNSFLINTQRLKKVMFRSKSFINGCFQRIGYAVARPARDIPALFAQILIGSQSRDFASRQWCVRRAIGPQSPPFTPNVFGELAADGDVLDREIAQQGMTLPFVFDIRNLLNHPAPGSGTRRMPESPLPPLPC